jgi:hypothetical protein
MSDKLLNFERAFSTRTAGCRRRCECGKEYYDAQQSYDWEEGELEKLEADPKAIPLEYSSGDLIFEGYHYVNACECWHERAQMIMRFLDGHAAQIAEYLTLEKKRKQAIADASPIVG